MSDYIDKREPTDQSPIDIPGGWVVVTCGRCEGRGYHHGFGEHGYDPDWCERCGGPGRWLAPATDAGRAALSDHEAQS